MVSKSKSRLSTITKKSDFDLLFQRGEKFSRCPWLLAAYLKPNQEELKFGWTIPKYVGGAVIRNKMKRWLRDTTREYLSEKTVEPMSINVVFRRKSMDFYSNLQRGDFNKCLEQTYDHIFGLVSRRNKTVGKPEILHNR